MPGPQNRTQGAQFEKILETHCKMQSTIFLKLPIGARPIGRGRWIKQKSSFDYLLIHNGMSACVDCKSFDKENICHSDLTPHQVDHLKVIQENGCSAGYIVWHRPINKVIFYEAHKLYQLRPRQSLGPDDGIYLGTYENFALGNLFYIAI